MPSVVTAPARTRSAALDGLRGVAIVLVVVSHGWILWPEGDIDQNPVLRAFFRNGNFAVTVFLFVSGFLVLRSLDAHGLARSRPEIAFARRVLRVLPLVLLALFSMVFVAAMDRTDTFLSKENAAVLVHVPSYTWNWYLQEHFAYARWDMGHLWYLSVDMQAFLLVAAIAFVLRRRPIGLLAAMAGLFVLFSWWRMQVAVDEPAITALLRTSARIDAFIAGVVAAIAVDLLRRVTLERRWLTTAAVASLVALPLVAIYCARDNRFLGWGVTLFELDLAVLLGAVALGAGGVGVLAARPLTFLGRNSLPIYVWHYPVFAFVQRHLGEQGWVTKTLLGLALTLVVCLASHFLVERRVSRWLADPRWRRARPRPEPRSWQPDLALSGTRGSDAGTER